MVWQLNVWLGETLLHCVALNKTSKLTIGRRKCDLVLDDPKVSGTHCELSWRGSEWVLTDLGSTNGTFVHGKRVTEQALTEGEIVSVGRHRLAWSSSPGKPWTRATPATNDAALSWPLSEDLVVRQRREQALEQGLVMPGTLSVALEVVAGVDAGRVYRVANGSSIIGRDQGDVPLQDSEVSRRHAMLECFAPGMLFVRDLGSTNGTYLNGRTVRVARVAHGDSIGVGGTVLRLACRNR